MRVGIFGLGLIGGSLARDLATAGISVAATDRDPASVDAALEAGVVERPLRLGTDGRTANVHELDLLVLALPVAAAIELLPRLTRAIEPDTRLVVTDVGSSKRSIVRAATAAGIGARFVGGHPMAGDHRSGWSASRTGLFDGATVWLCPTSHTADRAVARTAALWGAVGARPRPMDAGEHDRRLAWSSHLPQAAATALAGVLAEADIDRTALGPGGRDTTRLAGSNPELWTDVLLDNADEVGPALEALAGALGALGRAITSGDAGAIHTALERGRRWLQASD